MASTGNRSANMQPSTPKPTGSEKKFDRAKEEAFSNEGAPPPGQVSSLDDDADVESGKDGADAQCDRPQRTIPGYVRQRTDDDDASP